MIRAKVTRPHLRSEERHQGLHTLEDLKDDQGNQSKKFTNGVNKHKANCLQCELVHVKLYLHCIDWTQKNTKPEARKQVFLLFVQFRLDWPDSEF